MSADFEAVVYNNPKSAENIAWAESQRADPDAKGYIFRTIGDEMMKINDLNIEETNKTLVYKIDELKANYEDARVATNVGVGVYRECPPGWTDDKALTCREPIDTSAGYYNYSWGCGTWIASCHDGRMGCHNDCYRTWIPKWTGGRVVGKQNLDEHGGNLLRCPADKPDYVEGWCYARCPPGQPHHLPGMPYMCVKDINLWNLYKDDMAFRTYKALDVEDGIKCAQAQINDDWEGVKRHCGQDWQSRMKGIYQEIFTNVMGVISFGAFDLVNLIMLEGTKDLPPEAGGQRSFYGALLGEEPYSEFDRKHMEGITEAMIALKWKSRQRACKQSIKDQSIEGFLKFCEILTPELDEAGKVVNKKDSSGREIKNSWGNPIPNMLSMLPKLPGDDVAPEQVPEISSMIPNEEWLLKQIPEVPLLDESKIPEFPAELSAEIPAYLLPSSGIPPTPENVMPNIVRPKPDYNILDNPSHILLGALVLSAIFF
jgi:hypothetical protein